MGNPNPNSSHIQYQTSNINNPDNYHTFVFLFQSLQQHFRCITLAMGNPNPHSSYVQYPSSNVASSGGKGAFLGKSLPIKPHHVTTTTMTSGNHVTQSNSPVAGNLNFPHVDSGEIEEDTTYSSLSDILAGWVCDDNDTHVTWTENSGSKYDIICSNGSIYNVTTFSNFTGSNSTGNDVAVEYRYWVLFLAIFPLFTIFGNVLVVMSVYRERSLRTVTNYFICSLAVADLMVAILVMPPAVYLEVCTISISFLKKLR